MLRQRFGLDRPLVTQLASYVWGVVNLDLGFSFRHNTTVLELIAGPAAGDPRADGHEPRAGDGARASCSA